MNALLTLASEFIERMSNPAYGVLVNEDYAIRFAEVLDSEGSTFERTLKREAKSLTSTDALTAHGWMWLLSWARSRRLTLSNKLLLEITDKWTSVPMQSLAIEIATQTARWRQKAHVPSIYEFEHPFLRELLRRAVEPRRDESRDQVRIKDETPQLREIRTDRAESTLVALINVESNITLDAAAALLNHPWEGQHTLLFFYEYLQAGLDPETQKEWSKRLNRSV
jgi:hypothetical protein